MPKRIATTASAVSINAKVTEHDVAVSRAIQEAMADTSKPSAEQSIAESAIGPSVEFGRDINLRSPSTEDSSDTAKDPGLALGDFTSDAAELRADVADLTIAEADDHEEDPLESSFGDTPSRDELEASLFDHRTGDQEQDEDATLKDAKEWHDRSRGGISADGKTGGAGTAAAPVRFDDEGVHAADGGKTEETHKNNELGRIGKLIGEGGGGNLGEAARQAKLEDDLNSGRATRHTSSDGKSTVIKHEDGTKTVIHKNEDGSSTTTTLKPDGSTTTTHQDENGKTTKTESTPAPDTPREDYLPPEERQALIEQMGLDKIYRGSHDNDEVQPVDEDATGMTPVGGAGPIVDLKTLLLGGDRVDNELVHFTADSSVGDHGDRTSQNGGATDWGPDHTDPQGSGPEERNEQHQLEGGVESGEQEDGKGEDDAGNEGVIAHREEVSEKLPDTIAQHEDPKRGEPIDRDSLAKVRAEDVAPAPTSAGSGDVAHLMSTDRFEFVQTPQPTAPRSLASDISAADFDLSIINEDVTVAPVVSGVQIETIAQPVFDFDFT